MSAEPRIGSLFSGYAGLDLGVRAVFGGRVVWHCDNDPGASRILAHHWPDTPNLGDVTRVDWSRVEPVDILTAGYPCQPFSDAGRRKAEDDERYLWPEVARAISGLGPRLVVLENVRGHLVRGFDAVLGSLADLGYDARWTVVRAADAGAPHRRARVFVLAEDADRATRDKRWLAAPGQASSGWSRPDAGGRDRAPVADAAGDGRGEGRPEPAWLVGGPDAPERGHAAAADAEGDRHGNPATASERGIQAAALAGDRGTSVAADAGRVGCEGSEERDRGPAPGQHGQSGDDAARRVLDWGRFAPAIERWERVLGRPAPEPTIPGARSGRRLNPAFVEWMQGVPDGHVTGVPGLSINEQLRALGNGVVPQQAALALSTLAESIAAPTFLEGVA